MTILGIRKSHKNAGRLRYKRSLQWSIRISINSISTLSIPVRIILAVVGKDARKIFKRDEDVIGELILDTYDCNLRNDWTEALFPWLMCSAGWKFEAWCNRYRRLSSEQKQFLKINIASRIEESTLQFILSAGHWIAGDSISLLQLL